jgi:molybdate transport system regulatory protein
MNRYEVVVESVEGIAWLRLGRARLAARPWAGIRKGARETVRIRPEDVLLCESHPGRISARNVLPGHVRRVKLVPGGAQIEVDAGFRVSALVTRAAVRDLGLRRATPIFVIVKATAIVPEIDVHPRIRLSVEGPGGLIGPDRLDLLRAIDRTSSISAAAREVGISYRTAWLWVEESGRAWGTPLVARSHGGRGGGGALLTRQGHGLIETVTILSGRIRYAGVTILSG